MSKLNVYIDGSWLFKACAPRGVLANRMEHYEHVVQLDFTRLDMILLEHATAYDPECTQLGERYLCMSVFTLPSDFDSWPTQYSGFGYEDIEKTQRSVSARKCFVKSANDAGYSCDWITRPEIEPRILDQLTGKSGKYQEKCADTSIVFMLGQSLVASPNDIQCVVTGDADLLPPVLLSNLKYTRNLTVATTHPNEPNPEHRQSSSAINNANIRIPPVYLQDNLVEIVTASHVYECSQCQRVCRRDESPPRYLPRCRKCYSAKLYNR